VKCLVTGAAGFIGSNLSFILDDSVICCDVTNDWMLRPDDAVELIESIDDIDCVFHLGAVSSTTETNLSKISSNNITFSSRLLDICIEKEISFVYASSASVYGEGSHGFSEDALMSPLNYYAISKVAFDMFVKQKIIDNPNATIVGLRYFNVYGHNEDHKGDMASPVHKFLRKALLQKRIEVFEGSENFLRDFVHINDVVSITKNSVNFPSGVYNVGTGEARSFAEVAHLVADLTGASIIEIPFPIELMGKYQSYTCSDNRKIDLTGYPSSRVGLEAGVQEVFHGRE